MGLFRALIGGAIETAKLPFAILKDISTLGLDNYTSKQLDKIKEEADKADE